MLFSRVRAAIACVALVAVGNCASGPNTPLNKPPGGVQAFAFDSAPADLAQDGLLVSLSFSGGGTRAAAFGYGVLQELDATQVLLQGKC